MPLGSLMRDQKLTQIGLAIFKRQPNKTLLISKIILKKCTVQAALLGTTKRGKPKKQYHGNNPEKLV